MYRLGLFLLWLSAFVVCMDAAIENLREGRYHLMVISAILAVLSGVVMSLIRLPSKDAR